MVVPCEAPETGTLVVEVAVVDAGHAATEQDVMVVVVLDTAILLDVDGWVVVVDEFDAVEFTGKGAEPFSG